MYFSHRMGIRQNRNSKGLKNAVGRDIDGAILRIAAEMQLRIVRIKIPEREHGTEYPQKL